MRSVYVWNLLGRYSGGKYFGPKSNKSDDPFSCPVCKGASRPHVFAEPKLRTCDQSDCGWRSCVSCSVTWSLRTGAVMPMNRPPPNIYLER